MLSEKQLLANRKNALRSTGPRTAAGKAIASQNAVRHGLRAEQAVIGGEDAAEFDRFRHIMLEDLAPAGALEAMLADRIITGFWKLKRAGRIEAEMLDHLRQPLVATHQQQQADSWGPLFGDIIDDDLPSYWGPFENVEQATAAWDKTDDGIAYADGRMDADSANASFGSFLRQSRDAYPDLTTPPEVDLPAKIAAMRNQDGVDSKLSIVLAEIERTFRSIAHIPFSRRSIPATRLFLRDMRELSMCGGGDEALMETAAEVILELEHIETSIEKRTRPTLGQTLAADFTGSNVLATFNRYEGHIERSLYKAVTELQKLQVLRANKMMPAPAAEL
jgi:hypothetical protein